MSSRIIGRGSDEVKQDIMKLVTTGTLSLVVWAFLAFVVDIPSGLVHVPLAIGVVLLTAAIILGDSRSEPSE